MTRSRIAIFEGYNAPRSLGRGPSRYGSRYGAPLFTNPRLRDAGTPFARMGRLGRRSYVVPPLYGPGGYGPETSSGKRGYRLKRRGYRVKKGPNSPWQRKFKKVAKKCAIKAHKRGARKGTYQSCMRQQLKKMKRSKR